MATPRNIFFDQERDDLHENGSALRVITRNPRLESLSRESSNAWPSRPVPAAVFENELWLFENQGGNRDSGNNVEYVDENGVTQNVYVGNNGSTIVFKSTTEYTTMPVVTGDPYVLHRLKGQVNIDATFSGDPTVSYSLTEFYNAVAIAETEAEVAVEYAG